MKIATGIIGLVLMVIIAIQSILVDIGGSITHNTGYSQGGSVGIFVALLFLIAGAFAFSKSFVSMIVFFLAFILGVAVGATTGYTDMTIWGVVSIILSGLCLLTWLSDKKKKRANPTNISV